MGDHFVLLVDRLLTESTLEAAIQRGNLMKQEELERNTGIDAKISDMCSTRKMVECRICLDEDIVSRMEAPCSCSGSLKFAHRRCVQRWCNEKGDTTCEICHQKFESGYFAPPPVFKYPVDFRRNWRIVRRNLDNHQIIAMISTSRTSIDADDDDYAVSTSSQSVVLCRAVVTIIMAMLILGHTLLVADPAESYTFPLFMILMLGIIGIILSGYIILKTLHSFVTQTYHQDNNLNASAEEAGLAIVRQQQHVIAIR